MQKLAQQQNDKIETVNRERKYHQVISISTAPHSTYDFVQSSIEAYKHINSLTDTAKYCL